MLFSMGPDLQVLASHWMGLYCHIVRCNYINNNYFKCMNSRRGTHQRHYTALFDAISAGFQSWGIIFFCFLCEISYKTPGIKSLWVAHLVILWCGYTIDRFFHGHGHLRLKRRVYHFENLQTYVTPVYWVESGVSGWSGVAEERSEISALSSVYRPRC